MMLYVISGSLYFRIYHSEMNYLAPGETAPCSVQDGSAPGLSPVAGWHLDHSG